MDSRQWQLASTIFLVLGIASLAIGILLRFKVGRWILGFLLVLLFIFSLFEGTGDLSTIDSDTPLHKVSRFLFIAGGCCVVLALLIRSLPVGELILSPQRHAP
jgi:FtsH-binding integral membrane protein